MAFPKYQTKEVLNKVLNAGEDGLNVDLADSVTVTVDSEFPAAAALQDDSANPTTTSVGSHLLGYDSGNANWNRVEVDDAGHLQIDVLSITAGDNNIGNVDIVSLPASTNTIEIVGDAAENAAVAGNPVLVGGRYDSSSRTLGNGDVGAIALDADGAVHIADGGNTITVDGTVDLGSTDNAVLDAIAASLAVLDDWDDSNYANVNINLAGSDAPTGGGGESGALRVTIANDSTGVVSVDDGGGALTVDGTVTANLSATDNAVLDTIDATLDNMLYGTALAVTAVHGGSDHSLGATYEAFHIGVGGDISLDCATSGTNIVFKNLASGQMLPVRATVVNATNTTATNIVALKA